MDWLQWVPVIFTSTFPKTARMSKFQFSLNLKAYLYQLNNHYTNTPKKPPINPSTYTFTEVTTSQLSSDIFQISCKSNIRATSYKTHIDIKRFTVAVFLLAIPKSSAVFRWSRNAIHNKYCSPTIKEYWAIAESHYLL